jgi:hypothetical protein
MYEELIQDLRDKAEFLRKANRDNSIHNSFAETMSQAADVIEKLTDKNVGKWIPVTKKPPEKDIPVFVYLFGDSPYIAWINHEGEWETEEFTIDRDYLPKAWMQLPAPPML